MLTIVQHSRGPLFSCFYPLDRYRSDFMLYAGEELWYENDGLFHVNEGEEEGSGLHIDVVMEVEIR